MPPGTREVRHFHKRAAQFFYVLRGMLSVEVEGNEAELIGGQGIEVAAGQANEVRNRSSEDVDFLVISCHLSDR